MDFTSPLLVRTAAGLFCPKGNFYLDPEIPVPTAVLTHGHSDHAVMGSGKTIATPETHTILALRHGPTSERLSLEYGQPLVLGDVTITLHPAGHILGSAQVRIDDGREIWVVSGDYKRTPDPTAVPFTPIPCDVFITESTFALPFYRWTSTDQVAVGIAEWAQACVARGRFAVLYAYALGKAQRILAHLRHAIKVPIYAHGSMLPMIDLYRSYGIVLPDVMPVPPPPRPQIEPGLVLAPPSTHDSKWLRSFPDYETAFASGWMITRGRRRRENFDRGFVVSDHASWDELLTTIKDVNPKRVYVTHGFKTPFTRYLQEHNIDAHELDALPEVTL